MTKEHPTVRPLPKRSDPPPAGAPRVLWVARDDAPGETERERAEAHARAYETASALRASGFVVTDVQGAREALGALSARRFDAMIVDVGDPATLAFVAQLPAKHADVKILMLGAGIGELERSVASEIRAALCCDSPVPPEHLVDTIRTMLTA
jgi:DNA-binding response OmpR family regulator